MKRSYLAVLILAAVVAAVVLVRPAKRKGPEPIAYGKDTCATCRMILSRPGFGGEIRDRQGAVSKYDDVGCLLEARDKMKEGAVKVWVEDHEGSGLVALGKSTLVRGTSIETPMGHGIVGFRDAAKAKEFAGAQKAEVVTLASLSGNAAAPAAAGAGSAAATAALAIVPGGKRPFTDDQGFAAKPLYLRECSACHGERGDGAGPAAEWLDPRPRNFTKAIFKLRSTESGRPPATGDVLRTIERGIPGSAMPSFSFLTQEERQTLAAYVLHVADLLDSPEPEPIPDPGAAPASSPDSVARGKVLYEQMKCGTCHGPLGKGDGPGVNQLKDDEGRPIKVRDFTNGVFRGGAERADLYKRFVTGMDGTPMPSYADSISGNDRWALVDYVMSLKVEPQSKPRPSDPIAAGREVAAKYSCRGCHVLDDGKGGEVGPDLRVSGQKLDSAWVRKFLKAPREMGKIYPWRVWRMPHLGLTDEEVAVMADYLAAVGKRQGPIRLPDLASFPAARLEEGKNFYMLRCAECHALGKVIETPLAKQQGPDLIRVAERVDFYWVQDWIMDPKKVDPKSKMTVPGLTEEQAESVRMFVWKTAMAAPKDGAGTN